MPHCRGAVLVSCGGPIVNIFDRGSVDLILRHGIEKGYWTMEHLDFPSPDYERNLIEARQSKFFGAFFVPTKPYVNPLRKGSTVEVVAHEPEHDDLASAASANEGQCYVDLLPAQSAAAGDPPVPGQRHQPDLSRDQDPPADGGDHGQPPHLGTTGQHHPPSPRGDGTSAVQPQPTAEPVTSAPW